MGTRGTGRGRRLGLTRQKVIAAAVTVIERDGLDAFSLRRLADELDVETMSLYNHVPNKEALLDGVAELLLAGIDLSAGGTGSWQDRVRANANAFRAAAKRHPRAFQLVLTRPPHAASALETIRCALSGLSGVPLPPSELVHALRTYVAFVIGTIMRELGSAITVGVMDPDQVRHRVEEITATGDPLLAAVAPHLAVSDHDAEFRYGLETLIAGLATRTGLPYDGGVMDGGGVADSGGSL
ncbi:TetR/AcrR family transcriptional regulator C-terminal domain-containing protein [Streptantibioticus silvisoli]|uniref:TetR/AcrR family transcriptional regulator C-terminal domain-containing protein n=1 Tax=Streptantibioticus silvisoli TaxID=2705255 RepID=A0ABT6W5F2_9ACTN|nr:TetR/AcrR family transcriptional regulator C-terminal domain-containing protein [Streptantibioticus silvisoli]MDI5965904.1 TetR/AcrR family transcriptional regulator C-terminal domain-containing protein [Streptantibioticus silvisoli]